MVGVAVVGASAVSAAAVGASVVVDTPVVTPLLCERSYRQHGRVSMYARVGCGWVGGRIR